MLSFLVVGILFFYLSIAAIGGSTEALWLSGWSGGLLFSMLAEKFG